MCSVRQRPMPSAPRRFYADEINVLSENLDLREGDVFYDLYREFVLAKTSMPYLFVVSTIASLIFMICLVYLIRVAGQRKKGGQVKYLLVDRIYNEIHFLLVALFGIFSFFMALTLLEFILYRGMPFWSYVFLTLLGILYIADVAVGLS